MGSLRILFGRSRVRHRRALASERFGAIDPFGRPTLLYLTGTPRKRDQLLRDFAGREAFSPEVALLDEQLAGWWHRYGDGRAILPHRAVGLLIRRLLDGQPGRWPRLQAIPDRAEAARGLAAIDRHLAHRRTESKDPELASLRSAIRAAVDHTGGIRESDALEALIGVLRDPGPALRSALGASRSIIVDEPVGASPLLAAVALELARAYAAAGADVVLACGSGRDEGGREAAVLLGWEPPERANRVFAATAEVRRAAFEQVATGEAEVAVCGGSGLVPIEPWTEWAEPADRTLADAVADQLPVPVATAEEARAFAGKVRLVNPADRAAEVRWAARELARRLADGVDPEDCAVVLADPGYGEAVARALADHGVPFRPAVGWSLSGTPIAAAVRRIAGQALDGFDPDGLCTIADLCFDDPAMVAPPVEPAAPSPAEGDLGADSTRRASVDARALRRWCRSAGVRRGRPRSWDLLGWASRTRAAPAPVVEQALEELDRLAVSLEPLAEDADPLAWSRRLHDLFGRLGLAARCAEGEAAHAWAAVVRTVDLLVRDLVRADPGPWPAAVLREELDRALAAARFDPTPRSVARVPVLPLDDLLGVTAAHTFVLGLAKGAFPPAPPPSVLAGEPLPGRSDVARYVLHELLRNAEDEPWMETVALSWPTTRDATPVGPSPLVAELLDLPTTADTPLGAWLVERPADPPDPWSRTDRVRSVVLAGGDGPGVAVARARQGEVGPYDGILTSPPPPPRALSVSAVETYLACPARYWYTHLLRLSPPDDAAPELEPRRRGIALHAILERFLRERGLRPLSGEPEVAGARRDLHAAATAVLDQVEATGGFDPLFQRYARTRWLAGLLDDRPAGILRAWLDAEVGGTGTVPVAVEQHVDGLALGGVPIRGVVDRLDRLPGGAHLVTDYKTGVPPARGRIEAGLALQPVAYAEMVARRTGAPVAAAFLSLARADRVRRSSFVGEASALEAACAEGERRRAVVVEAEDRARRLDRASVEVEALVAGRFPPTRHAPELAGCPTCGFRRICRLDPERHGA